MTEDGVTEIGVDEKGVIEIEGAADGDADARADPGAGAAGPESNEIQS